MLIADLDADLRAAVARGLCVPAAPLALDHNRRFSPRHERALVRYYLDAGAGGLAVGVHSTQFEIREPEHGLFEPVLEFVSREIDAWAGDRHGPFVKIAGCCGRTDQACAEAAFAVEQGYHAGLLSLAAFPDDDAATMLEHCRAVAEVIPLWGFYLQPSVGGRILSYAFWREFFEIENVIAVKIAPFNRYQTLDVVRALAMSGRQDVTLYTGNDDNIVIDLLSEYAVDTPEGVRRLRIRGGLLGHWAVWTRAAARLLGDCQAIVANATPIPPEMLSRAAEVTDANAAVFDVAHRFAGCLPGIHEVLRHQGLLPGTWCLNPDEVLSPGQQAEIDRVRHAYPDQVDDDFVCANLHRWLED